MFSAITAYSFGVRSNPYKCKCKALSLNKRAENASFLKGLGRDLVANNM